MNDWATVGKKTVFVLGELNADLILAGANVQPEWNREKLVDSFRMALGSSSAITACGLAGLGLEVYFVGVAGDDVLGRFCLDRLRECGVRTDYVVVDRHTDTGVTLSLSTPAERALLTCMGAIPALRSEHLQAVPLQQADHLHFGSYYLQHGMRSDWPKLFGWAQAEGIGTSFDTGWDPEERWRAKEIAELLRVTDLFLPSETEALHIFGIGESSPDRFAELRDALPASRGEVCVKRGAAGATYIGADGEIMNIHAYDVTPIDTTGAGDSFNTGLIFGKLAGMELRDRLAFASSCGGIATQRIGGAGSVPAAAEVEAFMRTAKPRTIGQ